MRPKRLLLFAFLMILLVGCATATKSAVMTDETPPPANAGDIAVFGNIRLIEVINKIPMPAKEQDGTLYLKGEGVVKPYSVKCSKVGAFGVYLPAGEYKVTKIKTGGFVFNPEELTLTVPSGHKAVYTGVVMLDGTPTGVSPGLEDSVFVMSIKDEYREFAAVIKRETPGREAEVVKSLFNPGNALSTGSYPNNVHRAKDLADNLQARTDAAEEVVSGGITALTYILNPVWILTVH